MQFKPGQRVRVKAYLPEIGGKEATVLSFGAHLPWCYQIKVDGDDDCDHICLEGQHLEPIRDIYDGNKLVKWEEMPWQPEHLKEKDLA